MPFHFRMQKVLDYRAQLEDEARADLALKRRQLEEARALFERLREELRNAETHMTEMALKSAAERWLQEQYIKGLNGDVAEAAMQRRMKEQLVDEARKLLAARAMAKKLLEKLKERQSRQFRHEEQMKEQRVNDEMATLRFKAPAL